MPKKILIIAGEASGDLYGAHLVGALRKICPETKFIGVGGPKMKAAGVEIIHSIEGLSIIGFSEVLSKLGKIRGLYSTLKKRLAQENFDLAILVNYPGFNLRFARVLKRNGVPVVFYSSPQVWAWGAGRVKGIKKFVDKMIVFFKFEEEFYRMRGVRAEFVGHPLVDIVRPKGEVLGIEKDSSLKTISLMPGSRKSEVRNLFSIMLGAADIIYSKRKDVSFLITKHPDLPIELYEKKLKEHHLPIKLIDGKIYDCLKISDLAISVSGSVTLEAAILRVPTIIINRLSFLTALLCLIFLRLKHVGLINIIAKKRIMPELMQYQATPRNIAKEALTILSDAKRCRMIKEELESANVLVGPPGASERAAQVISRLL